WTQVTSNLGMKKVKQSNCQITIPDIGYNNSYVDNQTRGLRYSTGSEEGILSLQSERELMEVHEIQVQGESILLCGPTIWLEPESITNLQSNEVNRKEITGMRCRLDNLTHEGARLEDVISQMQGSTNERLSIPWLEVEDLYDGSMHWTGQEKAIYIDVEKMDRDYVREKDNREQKINTTTGRIELPEIADNG
ncbi:MAG: hypothetical protein EZS28_032079, partial [Streblomastix strix]